MITLIENTPSKLVVGQKRKKWCACYIENFRSSEKLFYQGWLKIGTVRNNHKYQKRKLLQVMTSCAVRTCKQVLKGDELLQNSYCGGWYLYIGGTCHYFSCRAFSSFKLQQLLFSLKYRDTTTGNGKSIIIKVNKSCSIQCCIVHCCGLPKGLH